MTPQVPLVQHIQEMTVAGGGKGFFVGGGTSRPTRIPVPTDFKALSADTGGQYSFAGHT